MFHLYLISSREAFAWTRLQNQLLFCPLSRLPSLLLPSSPSFRDRDKRRTTDTRGPNTDVPLYTNSSLIIRLCIMGKIWRGGGEKSVHWDESVVDARRFIP